MKHQSRQVMQFIQSLITKISRITVHFQKQRGLQDCDEQNWRPIFVILQKKSQADKVDKLAIAAFRKWLIAANLRVRLSDELFHFRF